MAGGSAAGLGIGMLILGATMAAAGIIVYKKKTSDVSYPRQRLDNEEN